jgi:hypothetical protein
MGLGDAYETIEKRNWVKQGQLFTAVQSVKGGVSLSLAVASPNLWRTATLYCGPVSGPGNSGTRNQARGTLKKLSPFTFHRQTARSNFESRIDCSCTSHLVARISMGGFPPTTNSHTFPAIFEQPFMLLPCEHCPTSLVFAKPSSYELL